MELIPQPHLSQHLLCPLAALPARDAGDSQCQLHIREDGLVRNQIVALENEANGVVSVGRSILNQKSQLNLNDIKLRFS